MLVHDAWSFASKIYGCSATPMALPTVMIIRCTAIYFLSVLSVSSVRAPHTLVSPTKLRMTLIEGMPGWLVSCSCCCSLSSNAGWSTFLRVTLAGAFQMPRLRSTEAMTPAMAEEGGKESTLMVEPIVKGHCRYGKYAAPY